MRRTDDLLKPSSSFVWLGKTGSVSFQAVHEATDSRPGVFDHGQLVAIDPAGKELQEEVHERQCRDQPHAAKGVEFIIDPLFAPYAEKE
jgi:hypothetical protein